MSNDYNVLDIIGAIERCQFVEFKNTVESGAIDVNAKYDRHGITALSYVCSSESLDPIHKLEWIKLLVSLGADLNAKSGYGNDGVTPLYESVFREDTKMIECLVEMGANLHERSDTGATLINHAAALGKIKSIRCLVSLGADVNAREIDGFTPIFQAAQQGQIGCIQCLAELGADVNTRTNDGYTPIFMAVSGNKVESLKCLKALGADLNAKTNDGRTALSVGIGLGDVPEAVEWLKNNGAK